MVVFDETHLPPHAAAVRPRRHAHARRARSARRASSSDPAFPPFLRFGSWIGGDRDGHPAVTAEVTEEAIRIQADHVLRGHEAVAARLSQTIAPKVRGAAVPRALAHRLVADELAMPQLAGPWPERYPDEPFRQRLGFIAERLRHTRGAAARRAARRDDGGRTPLRTSSSPSSLELQEALVEVGLARSAWGEVQDFIWQVRHLRLPPRQPRGPAARRGPPAGARRRWIRPTRPPGRVPGRDEVLETFRSMARIQRPARAGRALALRRLVHDLGAGRPRRPRPRRRRPAPTALELDVVPLFESSDALTSGGVAARRAAGRSAGTGRTSATRGDHQEVMLGYSDSTKELGYVAANWLLHRAQAELAAVADRQAIELTLFHGRGGAIGRGGGQLELAVAAQPPGSVARPPQADRAGRGRLDALRRPGARAPAPRGR